MNLTLKILEDYYAICKLPAGSGIPDWIKDSDFLSITRTKDELSFVCQQSLLPADMKDSNKDWRIFEISSPLDFSLVGIIAQLSNILKNEAIPIFVISTYLTDFILVKNNYLEKATSALKSYGYEVTNR